MPNRLLLAGPEEQVLARSAYPALAGVGFQVLAVVDSPDKLRDAAAVADVDLIVVEAHLAPNPDESITLLGELGDVALAVILPAAWVPERERFSELPALVAGFTAPVSWPNVAAELAQRLPARNDDEERRSQTDESGRALQRSPAVEAGTPEPLVAQARGCPRPGRSVRLAFYGTRGGVGTSTAALWAARSLAAAGRRVALFDSRARGDIHLMSGISPELIHEIRTTGCPVTQDKVTFYLAAPTEELAQQFDAVVVDGGRETGVFNADWIPVSKRLSEEHIARLVGAKIGNGSADSLTLGPLSIEIRD